MYYQSSVCVCFAKNELLHTHTSCENTVLGWDVLPSGHPLQKNINFGHISTYFWDLQGPALEKKLRQHEGQRPRGFGRFLATPGALWPGESIEEPVRGETTSFKSGRSFLKSSERWDIPEVSLLCESFSHIT